MSDLTQEKIDRINQEMGAACLDMIQHDLVEAGIIDAGIPPMFYPEAIAAIAKERDALRARIEDAPAVEITACNQIPGASDFDYGEMSAAVLRLPVGKRVALVVLEDGK